MKKVFLFVVLLIPAVLAAQQFNEYDRKVFNEGQVLTNADVEFAPDTAVWNPHDPVRVYSIHDEGDETIVTFLYSIYFDSQWLTFSKGIYVEDDRSGDIYKVRGYADGLTMDRLLVVKGCKGRSILVSLRFPKFRRSVKRISIYNPGHVDDIRPSNSRKDREVYVSGASMKKLKKNHRKYSIYE